MKFIFILLTLFFAQQLFAQEQDSIKRYKKRVLETPEVELLMSYYNQDGVHSPVGGGIGSEELTDVTPTIVITMPLNDDDVLTIDMGLSAYTSASSSNINPFNSNSSTTGASRGGGGGGGRDNDEGDDDHHGGNNNGTSSPTGTPWLASSGASKSDVLAAGHLSYSHSSDSRNFIWGSNLAVSNEFDYTSFGFGGDLSWQFNEKNTELGLKGQVYLDTWRPIYPTELHEYGIYGNNFQNEGYFQGVSILDQNGNVSTNYHPTQFNTITSNARNSYSASLFLSQIFSKKLQASLFLDVVMQDGLLSTPYHRIYFADRSNYYIGNASDIPHYTTPANTGVFMLADDIERMPSTRLKLPIGARLNYYINERFVVRSYYRYYIDDWGMTAHTASIELPIKLSQAFTVTPIYRFYTQQQVDYFAPFDTHLSTGKYYTSDYDLSTFQSNQYGIGLTYTDILVKFKISRFGMKTINLRYGHYDRDDGLKADIISMGIKFVFE